MEFFLKQILPIAILELLFIACVYLLFRKYSSRSDKNIKESANLLREEIRLSVQPKFLQLSAGVEELIELAIDIWRLEQRISKITDLPESNKRPLENLVSKFKRYLSKYDLEIKDFTNQKFNAGLNLDVLSVQKNPSLEEPIIQETVEPSIMIKGLIVKKAKVIVAEK